MCALRGDRQVWAETCSSLRIILKHYSVCVIVGLQFNNYITMKEMGNVKKKASELWKVKCSVTSQFCQLSRCHAAL